MNLADTPDPLDAYLMDWAKFMRGGQHDQGYPHASCGLRGGGVVGDFDLMVADVDWAVARATDAVIEGLAPAERCALHHRYLSAVYRFGTRDDFAVKLYSAREKVRAGLKRKGVWVE